MIYLASIPWTRVDQLWALNSTLALQFLVSKNCVTLLLFLHRHTILSAPNCFLSARYPIVLMYSSIITARNLSAVQADRIVFNDKSLQIAEQFWITRQLLIRKGNGENLMANKTKLVEILFRVLWAKITLIIRSS